MSFYIILDLTGTYITMRKVWAIVECSGRFWVVIQRKEKWEKINKMGDTPDGSHNNCIDVEVLSLFCVVVISGAKKLN